MMKQVSVWKILYKIGQGHEWTVLEVPSRYWCADPMLYRYKDNILLFSELFDLKYQIGKIGVSELINGQFTKPKIIMSKPYHMSYPCVFKNKDELFMIPETSQNGTLEIWKSDGGDFYKWKKIKNLLSGVKYVDSTVYIDDQAYIFTYSERAPWQTHVFSLDIDTLSTNRLETISFNENINRPAGYLFVKDGELIRPVQNNTTSYGESILINRIKSVNPLKEEKKTEIKAAQLNFKNHEFTNTHTISCIDDVEVFDVMEKTVLPLRYRLVILRKIRNMLYKIRYAIKYKKRVKNEYYGS